MMAYLVILERNVAMKDLAHGTLSTCYSKQFEDDSQYGPSEYERNEDGSL